MSDSRPIGVFDSGIGGLTVVKALRDFGLYYGIAFQMKDDLLDVTAQAAEIGKPVGNDLLERKMTIPLILALARADAGARGAVERFYNGNRDAAPEAVLQTIAACGGLDGTREQIAQYAHRAKQSLASLDQSPARAELQRLAEELTEG